jgi:hypothetical protein
MTKQQCGIATNINLKTPDINLSLNNNGALHTDGKRMRQLKELCTKYRISTFKTVANTVERNRAELELELRPRGVNTQGRNKRELVKICVQNNIETKKIIERSQRQMGGKSARVSAGSLGARVD